MTIFTASVICMDPTRLYDEIELLVDNGIDNIHIDVMDGHFVPRLGMYPEQVKKIREYFPTIKIDTHLLTKHPESYIELFKDSDTIIVHQESTYDLYSSIQKIKSHKKRVGIGLNISTSITTVRDVMKDVDLIMLMGFSPGILNQPLYEGLYEKIKNISYEYPNVDIMIDGGVKMNTIRSLAQSGATHLVCGSSTIYRSTDIRLNIKEMFNELR